MSKRKKIIISLSIILSLLIIVSILFFFGLGKVSDKKDVVSFEIKSGTGKIQIIENLKSAKIIKSKYSALMYLTLNKNLNLQAGSYKLDRNENTIYILKKISDGHIDKDNKIVRITFVEGKRITDYANIISTNFNIETEEVMKVFKDQKFAKSLIAKYDILKNDILNESIYYPLEGYLYPDTYEFYTDAKVEDIIEKMVSEMSNKLSKLYENINQNDYSLHELLTIASITEMEATNATDRSKVAQVINLRIEKNQPLEMDVTTYYGLEKEMTEVLTKNDLASVNGYNTRNANYKGLPVGPICNSSLESITAALNPAPTKYLYFFADIKTGEVSFFEKYEEFLAVKNKQNSN